MRVDQTSRCRSRLVAHHYSKGYNNALVGPAAGHSVLLLLMAKYQLPRERGAGGLVSHRHSLNETRVPTVLADQGAFFG